MTVFSYFFQVRVKRQESLAADARRHARPIAGRENPSEKYGRQVRAKNLVRMPNLFLQRARLVPLLHAGNAPKR